jgi:hypothetical protein
MDFLLTLILDRSVLTDNRSKRIGCGCRYSESDLTYLDFFFNMQHSMIPSHKLDQLDNPYCTYQREKVKLRLTVNFLSLSVINVCISRLSRAKLEILLLPSIRGSTIVQKMARHKWANIMSISRRLSTLKA